MTCLDVLEVTNQPAKPLNTTEMLSVDPEKVKLFLIPRAPLSKSVNFPQDAIANRPASSGHLAREKG